MTLYKLIGLLLAIAPNVFAQVAIPKDTSYTVWSAHQKLLKQYPDIVPVKPFQLSEVKEDRDVIYTTLETQTVKRELHADLFYPKTIKKNIPAVVLIHGGGWRTGDKSMNTPLAQQLALKNYVAMSVEYQLSPEAKYPAAVFNIKAAIRWLRANAKKYHIDDKRIAVIGSSAGGQLASLIGATNNDNLFEGRQGYDNFSSNVQAVVDLDGLLDFTHADNLNVKRDKNSADVVWLEGAYDSIPEKWKSASPLYHADKNTPPFLFINSSQKRFSAGYQPMVEKLKSLGIKAEVIELKDAPHSYWLFYPWFEPMTNSIVTFLDRAFKQ